MAEREYYRRVVDLAMEAGQIMMSAGAETHRVEDTIMRILSTTEFSQRDAFVLRTGITITLSDPRYKTISITRRVYSGPPHLSKISDVNTVSREFCAGNINIEQAEKKMREASGTALYTPRTVFFCHMLATSGFACVFGGGLLETLVAVFVGFLLGFYNVYIAKHIKKSFLADLLGAAIVVVSSVVASVLLTEAGIHVECQYIIAGSLMPLVPGTAFTLAVRDILAGDYVSGTARVMEALIVAASVALGVAFGFVVADFFGFDLAVEFTLEGIHALDAHAWFAILATFVGILGFCSVFSCPYKFIIICCSEAALCWAVYLLCISLGLSSVWASFFGAVFVDLSSQILARRLKAPVIIFLIIGVLPLVPGYGIYKVAYDMFTGGNVAASLTNALLLAGAVALAVIVMDTVIDLFVRIYRRFKNRTLFEKR
ncbi:MAG: threonine/serine exporter family protein [Clostridia bacterium]|nr:threonine/serine exporter family protein [Clostridia bacterium]MBQ8861356.1 threonine/serine exporter family protein [Clostridia bacterium]